MPKPKITSQPWLVDTIIPVLNGIIRPRDRVFEWGSGSSTVWFAKRAAKVIAIEHDASWADFVYFKAVEQGLKNVLVKHKEDKNEYIKAINESQHNWDVILIDGFEESRYDCARRAVKFLAPGGILILDNSNTVPNCNAVRVIDAQGWWKRVFEGTFYLDDEATGVGETTLWTKPLK